MKLAGLNTNSYIINVHTWKMKDSYPLNIPVEPVLNHNNIRNGLSWSWVYMWELKPYKKSKHANPMRQFLHTIHGQNKPFHFCIAMFIIYWLKCLSSGSKVTTVWGGNTAEDGSTKVPTLEFNLKEKMEDMNINLAS